MAVSRIWVIAAIACATPARADEPAPTCTTDAACGTDQACVSGQCVSVADAAKLHFDQGIALFNEGNFQGALAEFTESYRLKPLPVVRKNIGHTQHRLFRYADAIESLQDYLDHTPDATDAAEVQKIIAEIRALLADVTLTVSPPGASIAVDGKVVGIAPLTKPLAVAAGSHAIEISADGYQTEKRDILVAAQLPVSLTFALKAIPKTGHVRIAASVPRATVVIDGKPIGIAPLELELDGGGHQIEVTANGHKTHRGELVVTVGQRRDVTISLDRVIEPRPKRWYQKWYVLAPIGVVVAGVGVGIAIAAGGEDPLQGTLAPGAGKIR